MSDGHDTIQFCEVLEEGEGEGERCPLAPGIGVVDTDGDIGECPGDHLALDHPPLAVDGDVADTLGEGDHIGERVGRTTDTPDVLEDVFPLAKNAGDPDRRCRIEPDSDLPPAKVCPFPEKGSIAVDRLQGTSGAGVVELAEGGAPSAHALMVDLDLIAIDCGEDTPAGALRHRAARRIPGGMSSPLLTGEDNAPFLNEAIHPVLNGAPGGIGGLGDIGHREVAHLKCHLAHQSQVLFSSFKNPGHACSGCRGGHRSRHWRSRWNLHPSRRT